MNDEHAGTGAAEHAGIVNGPVTRLRAFAISREKRARVAREVAARRGTFPAETIERYEREVRETWAKLAEMGVAR